MEAQVGTVPSHPATQHATSARKFPDAPLVHKSTDYAFFRMKDNRDLRQQSLSRFRKLAAENLFWPWKTPILVDKFGTIKDGQHRFTVCKEFGYPVYFIRDEDEVTTKEIMALNAASSAHNVPDRLKVMSNSNCSSGRAVRTALRFWEEHGKKHNLSQTMVSQLLLNFGMGQAIGNAVLDGEYTVECQAETLRFLDFLNSLSKGKYVYSRSFVNAVLALVRANGDAEQVYMRLKKYEAHITPEPNCEAYKQALLQVFNRKLLEKNKLRLRKKGRPAKSVEE